MPNESETGLSIIEQFQYYQPIFQSHIKGEDIKSLAKSIGCSPVSMYNYIGGKVPDLSKCKMIVEEGIKILKNLKVEFTEI